MSKNENIKNGIFPLGELNVDYAKYFIGDSYLKILSADSTIKIKMGWLSVDTIIKIIGLIISCTFYPSAMMISVYITLLGIVLPAQYKAAKRRREK